MVPYFQGTVHVLAHVVPLIFQQFILHVHTILTEETLLWTELVLFSDRWDDNDVDDYWYCPTYVTPTVFVAKTQRVRGSLYLPAAIAVAQCKLL